MQVAALHGAVQLDMPGAAAIVVTLLEGAQIEPVARHEVLGVGAIAGAVLAAVAVALAVVHGENGSDLLTVGRFRGH